MAAALTPPVIVHAARAVVRLMHCSPMMRRLPAMSARKASVSGVASPPAIDAHASIATAEIGASAAAAATGYGVRVRVNHVTNFFGFHIQK